MFLNCFPLFMFTITNVNTDYAKAIANYYGF